MHLTGMTLATPGFMLRFSSLFAIASLLPLSAPTAASACSGPGCYPDQFLPLSGSLPQNAPAIAAFLGAAVDTQALPDAGGSFVWVPSMKSDISIACTSSKGSTTDLAFDLEGTSPTLLRPGRPLAVGESCVITGRSCGFDAPPSGRDYLQGRAEFRVSEAAALPATLGTLQVQPAKVEELEFAGGASCGERHQVCAVRLSVVLSNEAKPWKDALIYTTFIQESQFSGQGWSLPDPEIGLPTPAGGSYIGRGQDLLYYALDDVNPQGLTRGKHRVSMHATLAGTDVMIETPLQDVSLDCGTLGSNARSLFASGSNSACTVTDVRSSVTGARCWFALLVLIAFLRRVSARAARV